MKKQQMHLKDYSKNKDWTLFLDRDGVINERLVGDYVKTPDEFRFIDGVPEAIAKLSGIFSRIIVVTNQQGIGKGLMTFDDLEIVHLKMLEGIEEVGGRIDKIYYSPHLDSENNPMRKPGAGMALQAQKDFPEIDFKKSVMVGDGLHDMEFGKHLKMVCVFIAEEVTKKALFDYRYKSLAEFTWHLTLNTR